MLAKTVFATMPETFFSSVVRLHNKHKHEPPWAAAGSVNGTRMRGRWGAGGARGGGGGTRTGGRGGAGG